LYTSIRPTLIYKTLHFSRLFVFFILIFSLSRCSYQSEEQSQEALIEEFDMLRGLIIKKKTDSVYRLLADKKPALKLLPRDYDWVKARHYYMMGWYQRDQLATDSAIYYFKLACELVTNRITRGAERTYFRNLWTMHKNKKDYSASLLVAEQFRALVDETTQFGNMAEYHRWKTVINRETKEFEKAKENNKLRIKYIKKLEDRKNIISAINQRAKIIYDLGEKKEALRILDSLSNSINSASHRYKQLINGTYGIYLYEEKQFDKSLIYFKKALEHAKKQKSTDYDKRNVQVNLYSNIAEIYIVLKSFEKASLYLDSAYAIGIADLRSVYIENYWRHRIKVADQLRKENESNLYFDSLFQFYENQTDRQVKDQLATFNKARKSEADLLQAKQDIELADVKQENRTILGIVLFAFLLLGTLYFYRTRKDYFEKQSLQMQQRLLRTQMNPHFTFNILYVIQNLVSKDPLKASDYLVKFSRLLRLILENSMYDYISLEKEMESLRKYFDLQLFRFPNKFSYNITLENLEDDEMIFIPPMLLQPMIENSIEHGFKGIDYKGKIQLMLRKEGRFIECQIEDNGIGLSSKKNHAKQSASMKLIGEFLERSTKKKINIENKIESSKDDSGVIIRFKVPYRNSGND